MKRETSWNWGNCTYRAIIGLVIGVMAGIVHGQLPGSQLVLLGETITRSSERSESVLAGCPVECPPGSVPENEPCGMNFNFGCTGQCPAFQAGYSQLGCGQAGCGNVWADGGSFDEDWWRFTLQDDGTNTGEAQVCITIETDFPAVVELHTGFLCAPTLLAQVEVNKCDGPVTICECLSVTGKWAFSAHWIRIYPGTMAGGPMTSGLPCSAQEGNYTLELDCSQPCPDVDYEFGACCTPQLGGPCVQATESYCVDHLHGIWHGAGTPCWPNPCPEFGACCYRYSVDSDFYPCIETWEDDCLTNYLDPIFHGNYVPCDDVQCPGSPCGDGAGDCLLANGTPGCDFEPCCQAVCAQFPECCGDEWDQQCAFLAMEICWDMGLPEPRGACCHVIPGTNIVDCVEVTEDDCLWSGAFESPSWTGGATCDDQLDECIEDYFGLGSCCYVDAAGDEHCTITTQAYCQQTLQGDFIPNGSCDPGDCPVQVVGACCYEDDDLGWTCAQLPQDECEALPGSIFHAWQACTPNPCPQGNVGACCRDDDEGNSFCFQVTPEKCEEVEGTFYGLGIPCEPSPCEAPDSGACCFVDPDGNGHCAQVGSVDECDDMGGDFQGFGVPCTDDLCPDLPTGACCYLASADEGWLCTIVTESQCDDGFPHGNYQGDGTSCTPDPCACTGDETIIIRSGQAGGQPGQIGDLDDTLRSYSNLACPAPVTMLPFTATDFDAARNGPAPFIVQPHSNWLPSLAADPAARWVHVNIDPAFNNQGRPPISALYAADFHVQSTCVDAENSCVEICWIVDDRLADPAGGPNPIGAYINGVPLDPAFSGGDFTVETCVSQSDLPMLQPGLNTLYLYQRDTACAFSGLIFSATVMVEGSTCIADLNCDGIVDGQDLLILLSQWGPCANCSADLNQDGVVDGQDLLILLSAWGPCP